MSSQKDGGEIKEGRLDSQTGGNANRPKASSEAPLHEFGVEYSDLSSRLISEREELLRHLVSGRRVVVASGRRFGRRWLYEQLANGTSIVSVSRVSRSPEERVLIPDSEKPQDGG